MTEMTGMTKLEKLEWVHWLLDELDQNMEMLPEDMEHQCDIQKARDFIEDIREDYMDDLK
jgi:hypothetical protein